MSIETLQGYCLWSVRRTRAYSGYEIADCIPLKGVMLFDSAGQYHSHGKGWNMDNKREQRRSRRDDEMVIP